MLTDTTILRLRPGYRLQWETRQNSWVLLFPEGMITLNDTAGMIMEGFRQAAAIGAVISDLEARFPGQPLRDDVLEFLRDAHEQQWLVPV
jgi:pyrroloquinoline quinone biosynthesis protein D